MSTSVNPGLTIVAAMTLNSVIGRDGKLPWRQAADMREFVQFTSNRPVICGRKTFESVGLLKGRDMIVISHTKTLSKVKMVRSFEDALVAAGYHGSPAIIGGEQIYRRAIPYAATMNLTLLDTFLEGDAYFPRFDMSYWKLDDEMCTEWFDAHKGNDYPYKFVTLRRIRPDNQR
jgi:dihydrofolate reductase